MKTIPVLILLVFFLHTLTTAQTTYHYGINNKPLPDETGAVTRIMITPAGKQQFDLETFVKWRNEWRSLYIEKIRIISDNEQLVKRFERGRQTSKYSRFFASNPDSTLQFVEMDNDLVIRRGMTSSWMPLNLEGEIIEYFHNESIRSKAIYQNNQLVSNENWLENGIKYVDNVFYSADIPPSYDLEQDNLLKHVSNEFSKHKLIDINGTILVGFVILETGELTGARVVKGMQPDLDQIAMDAVGSFTGKWQPAILNNQKVNYFCTMPINFKQPDEFYSFDHMEFTDGMIFYSH